MTSFLDELTNMLTEMALQGIPGIKKAFMRELEKKDTWDERTGKYLNGYKEWILDTEGINLLQVLSSPEVVHTR